MHTFISVVDIIYECIRKSLYLYIYICIRHQHTYVLCVLYPNFPPDPPTLFFWFLFHGVVGSYCMQSAQVQSEPDSSTFNCSILMSFGLGNDFQMDFSRVTLCTFSAGKCLSTRQTICAKGLEARRGAQFLHNVQRIRGRLQQCASTRGSVARSHFSYLLH